jgi:serine/threonine protein kinase/outer membrane protein assembly factor BamB
MVSLGKYELYEVLGKGGFGTVYRAIDQPLEREVAVKVLHPQIAADREFIERFFQEAKLAARLDHPNIVPIYEVGEVEGRVYLAMKYMSGGSLRQKIEKQGRIPFDRALEIFEQTCKALHFIHSKDIVHRDLKPGNILFDENDGVRLADFGFAKALQGGSTTSSSIASLVGTPSYTAPEIWRNKGASKASDIYSLGCILFEMLTGKILFHGDSPADIMTRHVLDGPLFPTPWPEDVPPHCEQVLRKALAQEPADRYADSLEFSLALAKTALPASPALPQEPPSKQAQEDTVGLRPSGIPPTVNVSQAEPRVPAEPIRPVVNRNNESDADSSPQPTSPIRRNWGWLVGVALVVGIIAVIVFSGQPKQAPIAVVTPTLAPAPQIVSGEEANTKPTLPLTETGVPFAPTETKIPTETALPPAPTQTATSIPGSPDWLVKGYDLSGSRWNSNETGLKPPLKETGSYSLGNYFGEEMSIAGNIIYAAGMAGGDTKNEIIAITKEGKELWRKKITGTGAMSMTPAIAENFVIVGGQNDDKLYFLNSQTGEIIFTVPGFESLYASSPIVEDGLVFAFGKAQLAAVDIASQKIVWSYKTDGWAGNLAVEGDVLIASSWETRTMAFNKKTGEKLWQRDDLKTYFSEVVVHQGTLYLGSSLQIFALDVKSGATIWSTPLPNNPDPKDVDDYYMAFANNSLFVAGGVRATDKSPVAQNVLLKIDGSTGKIIWQKSAAASWMNLAGANGVIYVSWTEKYNGTCVLTAIDSERGDVIWQLPDQCGAVRISNGSLFLISNSKLSIYQTQ